MRPLKAIVGILLVSLLFGVLLVVLGWEVEVNSLGARVFKLTEKPYRYRAYGVHYSGWPEFYRIDRTVRRDT